MRRKTQQRRAFTLIELLVVIAIIAILAAMILAALNRAKAQARSTYCKNTLSQLSVSLQMYLDDNNSKYPPTIYAMTQEARYWETLLEPYYALNRTWTNAALQCPGYKGIVGVEVSQALGFIHPASSYGYNSWGTGWSTGAGGDVAPLGLGPWVNAGAPHGYTPLSAAMVKAPADMFAIGDSQLNNMLSTGHASTTYIGEDELAPWRLSTGLVVPERHGRSYNLLFADGHIEAIPPMVLFNITNMAARWNNDHQPHPEMWVP